MDEAELQKSLERASARVAKWPESMKAAMRVGKYADPKVEAAYAQGHLKESGMPPEEIDHPDHYGGGENPYEAIEIIRHTLTPEEFRGYIKGNVMKYTIRAGKKVGASEAKDLAKAEWCLNYMNSLGADKPVEGGPPRRKLTPKEAIALARDARTQSVERRRKAAQEEADRQGSLDD